MGQAACEVKLNKAGFEPTTNRYETEPASLSQRAIFANYG